MLIFSTDSKWRKNEKSPRKWGKNESRSKWQKKITHFDVSKTLLALQGHTPVLLPYSDLPDMLALLESFLGGEKTCQLHFALGRQASVG